jgi:lipoprotein-releasing system permease protein
MISYFEILIAFRYLKSKKRDAIISVIAGFSLLGVALGVAALIVVMGVMNGFHKELSSKMRGFNGDVLIKSYGGALKNYQSIIEKIKDHPEIISIIPIIEGQVLATAGNFSSGALVKGINPQDLSHKPLVADNLVQNFVPFDDEHLLLGYKLADNLGIYHAPQHVNLISPQGTYTAFGMVPRMKTFGVGAYFKSDMLQYDEVTIFMTLEMAQKYFNLKNQVTGIEIMLTNWENAANIAASFRNTLEHQYLVTDWQSSNEAFFNVLKTERVVMFLILTLIILVAAFNIISSLIMLVQDKTKDIAILRTMGATSNNILKIFLLCGCFVGITGTIIGVVLGVAFALNLDNIRIFLEKFTNQVIFDPIVYYLSALPCDLETSSVIKIGLMALVLAILATIYPALKAAKQSPIAGISNA